MIALRGRYLGAARRASRWSSLPGLQKGGQFRIASVMDWTRALQGLRLEVQIPVIFMFKILLHIRDARAARRLSCLSAAALSSFFFFLFVDTSTLVALTRG